MNPSIKSAMEDRRGVADALFERADFGVPVEAASGWSVVGNEWNLPVFLASEDGGDSLKASMTVYFRDDMSTPETAYALIQNDGTLLFDLDIDQCQSLLADDMAPVMA